VKNNKKENKKEYEQKEKQKIHTWAGPHTHRMCGRQYAPT
jgi:hypothetical protein